MTSRIPTLQKLKSLSSSGKWEAQRNLSNIDQLTSIITNMWSNSKSINEGTYNITQEDSFELENPGWLLSLTSNIANNHTIKSNRYLTHNFRNAKRPQTSHYNSRRVDDSWHQITNSFDCSFTESERKFKQFKFLKRLRTDRIYIKYLENSASKPSRRCIKNKELTHIYYLHENNQKNEA